MKISELIEELEKAEREHGDVECLIEILSDGISAYLPVDELAFEERDGYGDSICFLC